MLVIVKAGGVDPHAFVPYQEKSTSSVAKFGASFVV